jgi:predicted Ser/Thr protein kinase
VTENFITRADEELSETGEDSLALDEFFEYAQDNPTAVANSVNYLLRAIESFGTRTVTEYGEELERYRFFDDPCGDGEHAVLGNTKLLNDFVEEIRRRATDKGEEDNVIWFVGPTATGKSELKRCIINGLQGFAEGEEGAKYTLEWSLDPGGGTGSRMSYGDSSVGESNFCKSPVNVNPVAVLPEETRRNFVDELDGCDELPERMGPFGREAMDIVEERVDGFEEAVDEGLVRATRYYPEIGDGVGVLHTEDGGKTKQKLVGSWMKGAMQKFVKRGQKNPQAFSYDGVLSQGNGLVSILEDAAHQHDVLDRLLNVSEESMVKLDNKISMELDTVLIMFSNPDLESQLREYEDSGNSDPLRALRRRLDKYEFRYLCSFSTETMLIRRLLENESYMWTGGERRERVSEPVDIHSTEFAPRTIEAAAMYDVVTRLDEVSSPLTVPELAVLLEDGEVTTEAEEKHVSLDESDAPANDVIVGGKRGIPVTFTIDILVNLYQSEDVVLPNDVISEISEGLKNDPLFPREESKIYSDLKFAVEEYIYNRQEEDVLKAMVGDIEVTEEDVREYVDSLLAWQEGEEEEFDNFELMEFETRFLGVSRDGYEITDDVSPSASVMEFRDEILSPIKKFMWDNRDESFEVENAPLSESPVLQPLLESNEWDTVKRVFPDTNLNQWSNPPSNTETEELKQKTIERMIQQGYSEESAEAVSQTVVDGTSPKVKSLTATSEE